MGMAAVSSLVLLAMDAAVIVSGGNSSVTAIGSGEWQYVLTTHFFH